MGLCLCVCLCLCAFACGLVGFSSSLTSIFSLRCFVGCDKGSLQACILFSSLPLSECVCYPLCLPAWAFFFLRCVYSNLSLHFFFRCFCCCCLWKLRAIAPANPPLRPFSSFLFFFSLPWQASCPHNALIKTHVQAYLHIHPQHAPYTPPFFLPSS